MQQTRLATQVSPSRLRVTLKRANMNAKTRTTVRVKAAASPAATVAKARTHAEASEAAPLRRVTHYRPLRLKSGCKELFIQIRDNGIRLGPSNIIRPSTAQFQRVIPFWQRVEQVSYSSQVCY